MLEARGVSLSLATKHVLNDISLELNAGDVTVIMGPNGAGKTSLLKVMTGEVHAGQGEVRLNAKPLAQWGAAQRARMMGVLPQSSTLNFGFSVEEVILLGRTPHSTGARRDREISLAALHQVDGTHLSKRLYTQLSGGEKQRIQLARVLAQVWEPVDDGEQCLFLDEPSASLDLAHQRLLLDTVKMMAARGLAVAMVMHDFNLAASCADKLVMLGEGRVLAVGAVEAVLTENTIRQVFGVEAEIIRHPQSGLPVLLP